MARSRIEGRDLMVFDENGKSFAFATNHTLNITTQMNEINDKDAGAWGAQEPGKINWTITSDNIYDTGEFYTLYKWQIDGTKKKVYFGLKDGYKGSSNYNATDEKNNGTDGNWSYCTTNTYQYYGYCFLTDLSVNASASDKANYSATLTGTGSLSYIVFNN